MSQRWIALLGRCDKPTDAVEDYCKFLSAALSHLDIDLQLDRVDWDVAGWPSARAALCRRAASWRDRWVLVQYTALAWSARGFPLRFLSVLELLRDSGTRVGVVYHDAEPYAGRRLIDRIRRIAQLRTMRQGLRLADVAILTVPAERLSWLGGIAPTGKRVFIPVGANLPVAELAATSTIATPPREAAKTVAVFGVTGGTAGRPELQEIVAAVRFAAAAVPNLRLVVLGRETETLAQPFEEALRGSGVPVNVLGMLRGEEVVRALRAADVALFVRDALSSRRSSAIAAIACGVPLIARAGPETAPPITEAGVAFYSRSEKDDLGRTLVRMLADDVFRAELAETSRRAYKKHFSWSAIAAKYASALHPPTPL
jgi:glycosyltransferase involved in cell wall biosynthesis